MLSIESTIDPIHLLRSDPRIQLANALSKTNNTDNWSIDDLLFQQLHDDFNFEIDLFADKINRKVKRFVSHFYDPEAFALDAFSITWDLLAWVCPPVKTKSRTQN